MTKSQILLIVCIAVLTSACSSNYASSHNTNTSDLAYGSTDTYKDTIEIAGRVYKLQKDINSVEAANDNKGYNYAPAHPNYSNNMQQYAYYQPYQPLDYYGEATANNGAVARTIYQSAEKPVASESSKEAFLWYY